MLKPRLYTTSLLVGFLATPNIPPISYFLYSRHTRPAHLFKDEYGRGCGRLDLQAFFESSLRVRACVNKISYKLVLLLSFVFTFSSHLFSQSSNRFLQNFRYSTEKIHPLACEIGYLLFYSATSVTSTIFPLKPDT